MRPRELAPVLTRLRDAKSYAANILSDGHIGKLCIVTSFRTGSTHLVDLLDSHPNIRCDGEVLTSRPRFPYLFVRGRARGAARRGFRVYGLKLLSTQMMDFYRPPDTTFIHRLASDGFTFIHLRRRNILDQAISFFRASSSGLWREFEGAQGPASPEELPGASFAWRSSFAPIAWRQGSQHQRETFEDVPPFGRMHVDIPTLFFALRMIEVQHDGIDWMLEGVPSETLWYEDDLADHNGQQLTVDRICDRFAVEHRPVTTKLRKMSKGSLADAVSNVEELVSALRGTRYEGFLGGATARSTDG